MGGGGGGSPAVGARRLRHTIVDSLVLYILETVNVEKLDCNCKGRVSQDWERLQMMQSDRSEVRTIRLDIYF
jgi:hypothetical protein